MGASASIYINDRNIPESLKNQFKINESMKIEIANKDAQFIFEQSEQNWIDHKTLIQLLSERSKSQLHRIAEIYQKDRSQGGYGVYLEQKLVDMIGGPYGDFIRHCVMRTEALDAEYVHMTLNSIGCNENVLAEVFCASTCEELKATSAYYQGVLKKPLIDKVISKTTNGSPFQKFCRHILSLNRHPAQLTIDENEAANRAKLLYSYGLTEPSIQRNDDSIFQILCYASRSECQSISEQYERLYDMDLVTAILAKYKGSIALGLLLWTASLNDAIVKRIQVNLTDPTVRKNGLDFRHLSHIFAKYDHWKLKLLCQRYSEIFDEDLVQLVAKKLSGNYKKAVLTWLNSDKTCDGGYEFRILKLMETYSQNHPPNSSGQNHEHSNELQQIQTLLQKEYESLQYYSAHHALYLDAHRNGITSSSTKSQRSGEAYKAKFTRVKAFLLQRIHEVDEDNTGTLDPHEFWSLLSGLQIGYTDADITNLKQWVDMDGDGKITFDEIIHELTHCVVGAIEEKLHMSVEEKLNQLEQQPRNQQSVKSSYKSSDGGNTARSSNSIDHSANHEVSPNLITYLYDSFQAADTDKSGKLNNTEFWNIIRTVLSLTDGDREILEAEWDKNNDGLVSWSEALEQFTALFKKYINANQDHWIALIDKTNGQFFWYNLKDENSFWMTEEDQRRYQEMLKQGTQNEESLKPTYVPKRR